MERAYNLPQRSFQRKFVSYSPPKNRFEVLQRIEFEEALEPSDPRNVDTSAARGSENTIGTLAAKFGLDLKGTFFFPPAKKHVLFFGHIGCGKSTELRRYAKELAGAKRFFVVHFDISAELDRNNLQYADVLMALAKRLLESLHSNQISLPAATLEPLEKWFTEQVLTEERQKELSLKLESGASVHGGIPYLVSLFAKFTTAFRANTTYKESFRKAVRNNFTQFAQAFNPFLGAAEHALQQAGKGQRVLFIVDGTDKLRSEDCIQFFITDASQLLEIEALLVYTAPLSMKFEGAFPAQLDAELVLPMIKLNDLDGRPFPAGRKALRDMLLLRADRSLFADDAVITALIEASGGHPRELLRLLKLCCELLDDGKIDQALAAKAIDKLANEYRRFLTAEDYALLVAEDRNRKAVETQGRAHKLLNNLALLEYNDGSWRRSHPVVRTLEGYQLAAEANLVKEA